MENTFSEKKVFLMDSKRKKKHEKLTFELHLLDGFTGFFLMKRNITLLNLGPFISRWKSKVSKSVQQKFVFSPKNMFFEHFDRPRGRLAWDFGLKWIQKYSNVGPKTNEKVVEDMN